MKDNCFPCFVYADMQWYQEKCELLARGVCPAGAFHPGGLRAGGSRFCLSVAQMVLIQSSYKLIAVSLYSLARGHFSQPVVRVPGQLSHTITAVPPCSLGAAARDAGHEPSTSTAVSTDPPLSWGHLLHMKLPHRASPSLTAASFSSWDWRLGWAQGWTLPHLFDPVVNSKRHLRTHLTACRLTRETSSAVTAPKTSMFL